MTEANTNQDVCDVCDQDSMRTSTAWRNAECAQLSFIPGRLFKFPGTDFPDGLQAAAGSLGVACGSCRKEE